jgi:Protein of unknown function (DUF3040)
VPLNENEQRILQEIERRFYAHDPDSARRISSTTLTKYLARNCRWAALGLLTGLIILVVGFASSWVIGVFGFLIMLASAVILIQNLRKMGRFGLEQMTKSMSGRNLGDTVDDAARRFRQRFRKDDDGT